MTDRAHQILVCRLGVSQPTAGILHRKPNGIVKQRQMIQRFNLALKNQNRLTIAAKVIAKVFPLQGAIGDGAQLV